MSSYQRTSPVSALGAGCRNAGGIRSKATAAVALASLFCLFAAGCRQAPVVNVTDPAVYTSLHIYAARRQLAPPDAQRARAALPADTPKDKSGAPGPAPAAPKAGYRSALDTQIESDLSRYFRTTEPDYQSQHLRMDDMLDHTQRVTDVLRIYETMVNLSLQVTPGSAAVPDLQETDAIAWAANNADDPNARRSAEAAVKARATLTDKEKALAEAQKKQQASVEETQKREQQEATRKVNDVEKQRAQAEADLTDAIGGKDPNEALRAARQESAAAKTLQSENLDKIAKLGTAAAEDKTRKTDLTTRQTALTEKRKELEKQAANNPPNKNELEAEIKTLQGEEEKKRAEIRVLDDKIADSDREKGLCEAKKIDLDRQVEKKTARVTETQRLLDAKTQKDREYAQAKEDRDKALKKTPADAEPDATVTKLTEEVKTAKTAVQDAESKANAALAKARGPLQQLRPQMMGLIADSPTDRLDRAHDFYSAYTLKTLLGGDSRAVPPDILYASLHDPNLEELVRRISCGELPGKRLVLLVFQTNIECGDMANMMAGVRIRITGAQQWIGSGPGRKLGCLDNASLVDQISVLRLHPSRSYDLDDQLLIEKLDAILDASVAGTHPGSGVGGAARVKNRKLMETRRSYLLRVSKNASFADAGRHEFGWNFYPTNLIERRPDIVQRAHRLFFMLDPVPDAYLLAFLEPGARDCSAYLLVPSDLKSITFCTDYVLHSVDADIAGRLPEREKRYHIDTQGRLVEFKRLGKDGRDDLGDKEARFTVELPDYHPAESAVLALPTAPATGAAAPRSLPAAAKP